MTIDTLRLFNVLDECGNALTLRALLQLRR